MQEILAGLAEADRSQFASEADVRAVFDKHIGPLDQAPDMTPHRPPGNQRIGATAGAGASTGTPNSGVRSAARCRKR
jgi:hypothetical protein